jgi:predicted ArsR family transcriptional regulator
VTTTLTERQAEVLAFIEKNARVVGPTVREIAAGLGLSPAGPVCHLKALEKKGAVRVVNGHVTPADPKATARLLKKQLLNTGFDPAALTLAGQIDTYLGSTE